MKGRRNKESHKIKLKGYSNTRLDKKLKFWGGFGIAMVHNLLLKGVNVYSIFHTFLNTVHVHLRQEQLGDIEHYRTGNVLEDVID